MLCVYFVDFGVAPKFTEKLQSGVQREALEKAQGGKLGTLGDYTLINLIN